MASTTINYHNSTVLRGLREGDLVEFNRGLYSHWAVYIGKGNVIHMTGTDNDGVNANLTSGSIFTICGRKYKKAFVRADNFWKVASGSKAYKNNDKDRRLRPSNGHEIIQRAMNKIGEVGYNALWSNCEHLASYCRYGEPMSDQIKHCQMAAAEINYHNCTVLTSLREGDLVKFDRGLYSHWAVYIGEGIVIHMAGDDNDGVNSNLTSGSIFTICGRKYKKAFVRAENFFKVASGSKAYRNNDKDRRMRPSNGLEIIQRAMNKIGEVGYNALWSNCEHFASYCRYGEPRSDQADVAITTVVLGVVLFCWKVLKGN